MYNVLKIYKNYGILTQLEKKPCKLNAFVKGERNKKRVNIYDDKLENSVSRARSKIFDYALMNEFEYFFTGTINGDYDRTDYNAVFRKVSQKFRDMRKEFGFFEYLIIPELHKDMKNYHFHGLLKGNLEEFLYINNNGFYSLSIYDKFGFNSISKVQDVEKVSSYILKYVTKSISHIPKGNRIYFHSNGLVLPDEYVVEDFICDEWDFQNDFCKKIKIDIDKCQDLLLK